MNPQLKSCSCRLHLKKRLTRGINVKNELKRFNVSEEMLGKEWAGLYVIYQLDARDYLHVMDDAIRYCQSLGGAEWDGQVPNSEVMLRIVCKSTTHDGKVLDPALPIPSKLYEALAGISIPANTLTQKESQSLFLVSSTASPALKVH